MSRDYLPMWTVYNNPRDYPGRFVVREYRIVRGGEQAPVPLAIVDTLEEARNEIQIAHPEAVMFQRSPDDDPAVVETWL